MPLFQVNVQRTGERITVSVTVLREAAGEACFSWIECPQETEHHGGILGMLHGRERSVLSLLIADLRARWLQNVHAVPSGSTYSVMFFTR